MEWDYSGRKGRDGQKKKIGKANESEKKKRAKDEVNGQGGKGRVPRPHTGLYCIDLVDLCCTYNIVLLLFGYQP